MVLFYSLLWWYDQWSTESLEENAKTILVENKKYQLKNQFKNWFLFCKWTMEMNYPWSYLYEMQSQTDLPYMQYTVNKMKRQSYNQTF